MFIYLILSVVISTTDIFVTKTMGDISQSAVSFDTDAILRFLLIMAMLTGIQLVFSAIRTYLSGRYKAKTEYNIRGSFVVHILRISYEKLIKKNSGDMMSVFSSDLPGAILLLTTEVFQMISGITTLIISAIFMFRIHAIYTLIFLIMYPVLVFLQVAISMPINKYAQTTSIRKGEYNSIVNDSLQNVSTIAAYGLEDYMEARYLSSYDLYFQSLKKQMKVFISLVISGILITFLPLLFIYIASAQNVVKGSMSLSEFIAYSTFASSANSWLMMLSQALGSIQPKAASLKRLLEKTSDSDEEKIINHLEKNSNPSKKSDNMTGYDKSMGITFSNVDFSYDNDIKVLDQVSFHIKAGEKIAFTGTSGSGKSTIIKLLLSLYKPCSGNIQVFGSDIGSSLYAARDLISYIPQDCFLFQDSIGTNITCLESGWDEDKLNKAAEKAGISDFIKSLPEKFNTILTESADNISGGQKQRIAAARAFYKDAPIIIIDEGTSALDLVTEKTLLSSIFQTDKTVLMIAHRVSAIKDCDRILVLDKGKIIDEGDYMSLSQKDNIITLMEGIKDEK